MSNTALAGPAWTRGDYMRKARTSANQSVAAMAIRLGVTAKTINNYEADRTTPPRAVIDVWAMVCDAEWLRDQPWSRSRWITTLPGQGSLFELDSAADTADEDGDENTVDDDVEQPASESIAA